ncbi:MAG: DegV family protein [Peptostreptococcaceae bacterium]|nr:DegV family protein [Peptostreptococcaceae bacterium]
MKIKLIGDSLCDLPKDIKEKYNIEIIPLTIIFDNKEYKDGVDLTNDEFYKKLKESKILPKTSQITPAEFNLVFEKYLNEYDKIIYISGSSDVTGTYRSAMASKEVLNTDKIEVFDSKQLSFGYGFVLFEIAKFMEDKTMEQIRGKINELIDKVECIFSVETLEYLKKGGRLSSTKAAIGTILNIKPILKIENGKVKQVDQARGSKKSIDKLIELMLADKPDISNIALFSGDAKEKEALLEERLLLKLQPKNIIRGTVGATIGTHSGPGIVALMYIKE